MHLMIQKFVSISIKNFRSQSNLLFFMKLGILEVLVFYYFPSSFFLVVRLKKLEKDEDLRTAAAAAGSMLTIGQL